MKNFLSKAWSGLKTGAKSVATTLNKFGTNLARAATGQLANASSALNFNNPVNNALEAGRSQNQSLMPNMTVAPSATDPGGPGRDGISVNNPYFKEGQGQSLNKAATGSYFETTSSQMRPSTYQAPVDQYGRTSTKQQGQAYKDAKGNYIIPETGFGGLSGAGDALRFSTGGADAAGLAASGMTGMSGGGGSAYTGLLGAVGTTGSGANLSQEEESAKKKQGSETLTPAMTKETAGAVGSITSPFNTSQFAPPSVPDIIDAGYLSKVQESINSLASAGSAISFNDRQSVINQITQNLMTAKTRLDQQLPAETAEKMVEDTKDQMDFMNQSGDPFGVKQALDEFRANNTNLGSLMGSRVELMKNVQALNEAYRPILKDIKENPDLPKALARRRIEDLATTQKEVLQGFLDQLEIVNQQIDDQNEFVNRNFQILTMAQNQEERAQNRMQSKLKLFLDTGAIGGFTDEELESFANAAGMPVKALRKAKEAALTPKLEIVTNEDVDGNLLGIDKNTGKTLWKIPGAGKPQTGTEKVPEYQQINNGFSAINSLLTARADDGTPYADQNGYFTSEGFRRIVTAAREDGISRDTLIKQYGDRFSPYGITSGSYGLTLAEKKALGYE